ncbi:MAG: hypothetical protein AAB788_03545 [Patescibacteria group bacterium]
MKKWQKIWLYFLISYSFIHLIRDVFQDLGIKNLLSTVFVNQNPPTISQLYWSIFNTYVFEITEIILGIKCLINNKFGMIGYSTIVIAITILTAWSYYWFFF